MSQEFLDCSDVITIFQQVRSEGMAQGVTPGVLSDPSFKPCLAKCTLQYRLVKMLPSLFTGDPVYKMAGRGENPLPSPFFASVRIFAIQRVG